MSKLWRNANKSNFIGLSLFSAAILTVMMMFYIQFSVEDLQDHITSAKNQISDHEDHLRLLEVEWVYLTRPERLRQLSASYLKDNGYVLVNQILEDGQLKNFDGQIRQANLAKESTNSKQEVALSSAL